MYLCPIKYIMLKIILVVILYTIPGFMFAQKPGSLTIISDSSVPLIFYVDNIKQNDSAVSMIRIEGLTDKYYKVIALHKDTAFINRYLVVGGIDEQLVDATYRVRRLNTGRTRVSLYAMFPANPNFRGPSSLYVTKIKLGNENIAAEIASNQTQSDTVKVRKQMATTALNPEIKTESKVVKGKNRTVNSEDRKAKNSQENIAGSKPVSKSSLIKDKAESQVKPQQKNKVPLKKCNGWPITKKDFDLLKKTIMESKNEDIKLKNAKSLITGSCFLVSQLDEITALLKAENSKLDFVKFAYSFTIDRPNYNRLEKYFTTTKSKEEFSMIHGD